MIFQRLHALTKRSVWSVLLIVLGLVAQLLFFYVDEIAERSGVIAQIAWLFNDTILFSFLMVFVGYAAWILGLGGGALVLGVALTLLGFHRIVAMNDATTAQAEMVSMVITGVGSCVALVAFARWGQEYQLREREEALLRESEDKYRALVEHSAEAIFLADVAGTYIEVNPKACQLTGYSREELLGMHTTQLLRPNDPHRPLAQAVSEGLYRRELVLVRKDGSEFVADVTLTEFDLRDQRVVLGIARDVTEERRLQADILGAKEALEEGYRLHFHSLGLALAARNPYTAGHGQRVRDYATAVGHRLGLQEERLRVLGTSSELHDYGKIGIPDAILLKAGALTPAEWAEIRRHPELGVRLIEHIPFLRGSIPIIRAHHEKMDGSGYPDGLQEQAIPLEARIIGVVDAYDALTTERSYRPAHSHEEALAILRQETAAGKWDPQVSQAFFEALEDWVAPAPGEP